MIELQKTGDWHYVVATEKIRQGKTILDLPTATQPHRDQYSIEDPPGIHRDCSQSMVRGINHSCSPNAAVRNGRIIAWKCIEPGEEITIDYRRTEEHLYQSFICNCCGEELRW